MVGCSLADIKEKLGQPEEAVKILKGSLDALLSDADSNARFIAIVRHNIANCLLRAGECVDALPYFEQSRRGMESLRMTTHSAYWNSLHCHANCLFQLGRMPEGEELYGQCLEGTRQHLGPDHPKHLDIQQNYASILVLNG